MKLKAILTFDLEFWHNSQFLQKYLTGQETGQDDQTEKMVNKLLAWLAEKNQKATFFVLGQLAEKYPAVIKQIADQGHEIASHGHSHRIMADLDPAGFEQEIKQSKELLEKIVNRPIIGFRAPNFSLDKKINSALVVLEENGFKYDSSCHPLSWQKIKEPENIKELAPTLGGIYFRFLPIWLYWLLAKLLAKTELPILYFHPNELFQDAPRIAKGPWLKRKIKYWGTNKAWQKFAKLTAKYEFITIKDYLTNYQVQH